MLFSSAQSMTEWGSGDDRPAHLQQVSKAMTVDEALELLELALNPKHLSDLQHIIFCRSWLGQSYERIAEDLKYDPGYIRDVGSQLWHGISEALEERVTKKNMQSALRRYQQKRLEADEKKADEKKTRYSSTVPELNPADSFEFPSGVVPLSSSLYVVRSPLEEQACREMNKPGSLIRIRAAKQMGKSSLMHRIMVYAKQQGMQTATIDLQRADNYVFDSLNQFLRWLCLNISQQLELTAQLDDYWNPEMGSKMSCTLYFQRYLLKHIDQALVLAFDEVNRLFEHPELAMDFLPLLRSWYEDASEFEIWQKLRLIVVHTTEAYIPLNINQSPFNVGLPLRLPEFTLEQVQDLAIRHGLDWADTAAGLDDLRSLLDHIGGHPYLVRLALYALRQQSLTQLLESAPTPAGIYGEHLRQLLNALHERPELAIALQQILAHQAPHQAPHLEAVTLYQLESLGLIKLHGNEAVLSRELYRSYFQTQLM